MFAKRFPSEYEAVKNAVGDKIVSFMSSQDGGQIIVKFHLKQPKVIFFLPTDYPSSKIWACFMNEVPNHPFYQRYNTDTNLATIFRNCNTIIGYIDKIYESLDDTNLITDGIKNLSIDNTNLITNGMRKLRI